MAGSRPLGITPGNGPIGGVDNGVKEHAVMPVLSFVDLVFLEIRHRVAAKQALVALWWGPAVFYLGDHEQAGHGHVAGRPRLMCLVAERANPVARPRGARSVCADFGAGQRLDDLGTKIPRACKWSRVGAELAGTAYHSGSRDMVLSWQTRLASSARFYLSAMGD